MFGVLAGSRSGQGEKLPVGIEPQRAEGFGVGERDPRRATVRWREWPSLWDEAGQCYRPSLVSTKHFTPPGNGQGFERFARNNRGLTAVTSPNGIKMEIKTIHLGFVRIQSNNHFGTIWIPEERFHYGTSVQIINKMGL